VAESGAQSIRDLLRDGVLATSRLTEMEVASALSRRCREGALTAADRDRAIVAVHRDLDSLYVIDLTPDVVARSVGLLARLPLRAADALQLASCLELQHRLRTRCLFVCCDDRLLAAARQEGLATAP
jgi:predicted nucleic acid-binding protein